MRANVLIVIVLMVLSLACKKSWMTKESNLTLTGTSATSVTVNQNLTFNLEFSHPYSGDIYDTLGIKINYKSCKYKSNDTTHMDIPVFTNAANQVCKLAYTYKFGQSGAFTTGCSDNVSIFKSDSAWFQFWLIDKNSNSSDTISSPMVFLNQ